MSESGLKIGSAFFVLTPCRNYRTIILYIIKKICYITVLKQSFAKSLYFRVLFVTGWQ